MKHFLENLNRKAGQWVNMLDEKVQPPFVQIMSGEVFTHGTASIADNHQQQCDLQPEQPATPPGGLGRESAVPNGEVVYPPVLRKANALGDM